MAATIRSALQATAVVARAGSRMITVDAKAVRYSKHGHPTAVLKTETIKLDSAALKAGDVFVKMVAAPITPADIAQVTGFAGKAASFPRVGGNEGVGIVEEAGASSGLKKGDVVVASKGGIGTWSTHVIAPADSFTKVDLDVKKAGIEAVAAAVVPYNVAKKLLESAALKSGDVIMQNNAGSTVGQAVIQLAAAKGLRSINTLRATPNWAEASVHLQSLGAAAVVSDDTAAKHEFKKLLADYSAPKLGLNATGGASASTVAKALGNGATMVTYGASSGRPVSIGLDAFTGKDITFKGFNLDKATAALSKADRDAAAKEAVEAVSNDKVKLMVAREPFGDFKIALERSLKPFERKVVLTF